MSSFELFAFLWAFSGLLDIASFEHSSSSEPSRFKTRARAAAYTERP